MSADNWGVCPRCEKRRHADIESMRLKVADSYGKVPVAEFDDLREQHTAMRAAHPKPTLREDYEIGIDEGGGFYAIYKGRCSDCDFSHEFRHEEVLS